ncbi:MAG: ABC-2 family transporter protein [Synergistetes bacterium ADurb.BinA166]|nr:MAG: ABC-2 family transporter protein [Synergistetes bacterium ADurb.BinA166]
MSGVLNQLWTIARHSIVQAIRMRLVAVLVVFLLVLIPALPFLLQGDKTHAGQLRLVLTYTIYLISFILSVLTLFLSAITLNTEIRNQHIFLLDPKPVSRGILLLGKWVGVMLIIIVLLVAMLAMTYGIVQYLGRQMPWESAQEYKAFRAEVMSARRVAVPPLPDLREWVKQEARFARENNLAPADWSDAWLEMKIHQRLQKAAWRVAPGETVKWEIKLDKTLPPSEVILIRFRHHGDKGAYDHILKGQFVINESAQPVVNYPDPLRRIGPPGFQVGVPNSFMVSARVLKPDGALELRYTNTDPDGVGALFPFEDGVQILYPSHGIGMNFLMIGGLMFSKLTLIAIVGIFASTFMSFPVAVFFSLVVFVVGHLASFIFTDLLKDLYLFGTSMVPPWMPLRAGDEILRNLIAGFFSVFPNFAQYDLVPVMTDGILISYHPVLNCFVSFVVIRGGVLAVLAWYIYRRRELAALTPTT